MVGPPQTSFGAPQRRSHLLSGGRGAVAVSTASTIVVLAAIVALFFLAPGSAAVRHTFFNPEYMWKSLIGDPKAGYYSVGEALWLNIRMFLAAEVRILEDGQLIAVHPVLEGRGRRRIAAGHRTMPAPANSGTPRQDASLARSGETVTPRSLAFYDAVGQRLAAEGPRP